MKTTRLFAALIAPLAVLLIAAAPAAAHGGEGEAEITSVTREGDDVVVTAHVKYIEDGHGVPDATVTVVVDDGTPVPMEAGAEEGDYQATVPAAEGAAIRVTSVEPATTAETTAPAAEETPTTEATTTTSAPPDTANDDPTTATGDEEEAATTPTPVPDEGDSDDGGISPIVIGAIVAVVLAAVVMAVILLGKKPSDDGPEVDS